jgi:homoserine dehydrogenase
VLSDVSALKFDYKYEYRKADEIKGLQFSNDFFLKVYVGSPFIEAINEVPFYHVDQLFQSEDYVYQTGWVKFSELSALQFNNRNDLSIIVLSDALKATEDLIVEQRQNREIAYL